ncbi:hypothetical protein [Alloyangia pacifica]|uniref:Transmembrane protein (PGPGW) n=1 Tax=Alloyangia pacifica TaxID=311180 RepID=A0A1I6WAK1_9RHOB|nr:hypothetical protein [Alloyangia pacifica]SDI50410.1 hypothetical protein SAMN04488245_11772 [Alloyangia pacifica]SFT23036.1 hypothetical protein SAMN04488050_11729 [Alloyangia pacifica]
MPSPADKPDVTPRAKRPRRSLKRRMQHFLVHVRRRVPPGLRLVLGLLLICGGILGFLPILGFWMIPLGFAVAMLDLMPLYRRGLRRGKALRERDAPEDDDLT